MDETRTTLNRGIILFMAVAGLLLCGVTTAGGFVLGRQTAAAAEPVERQVVVEVTRDVIREIVREVTVPPAGEGAMPAPATSTPIPAATTENGDSVFVPPPTPTFVPGAPGQFTSEDLEILFEAWQIAEENFDGSLPNDTDLRYGIVEYAIGTLGDEYTRFIRPEIAERSREDMDGSFEGIGAFVRTNDDGQFEIVRPIDGQPADLAGLKAGDIVLAADGVALAGKSIDESIQLVRGPRGTPVTLTISRAGVAEPFDVTIIRETIIIPVVESEYLEEGIAYVRLTSFNRNAESQLLEALEPMLAQNPLGIILDLRDNPGGFLDQAVAVADIFLPEGVILRERNNSGLSEVFRSEDGGIGESLPLIVLVNAGSASASEIVAGAVQDTRRGTVLGEVTFGKGSVQTVRELSDGSEIRVTIARWYTPNDNTIDGRGVTPDVEVPTPEDLGGESDTQLQRAIAILLGRE